MVFFNDIYIDEGKMGMIFLQVAEGAKLCRRKRIIGVDVNQDRFEIGILI